MIVMAALTYNLSTLALSHQACRNEKVRKEVAAAIIKGKRDETILFLLPGINMTYHVHFTIYI